MKNPSWSPFKLRVQLALAGLALAVYDAVPASAQSLWKPETSRSMVADKRARAVGDIVTILVQEDNTTSKDNSTKTSKESSVNASIDTFLFSPKGSGLLTKNGQMPGLSFDGKNDFTGSGSINNSEKISARIATRVVDVLPNGNLVIEGSRRISFSGESQDAVLRGVIRTDDVSANNTVYSYNVADATIKYVSKGTVSDAQNKGWFTRIWDKVTPF